ncbi:MAG: ribonuclease III [Oscillospiraceae bacterium]|jgi:ribonuclease-3 family protein|nr:ribonuclease III [Oscillospiraceae bacterium]
MEPICEQEHKILELGTPNLAFVGDAVYELLTRTKIAQTKNQTSAKLHEISVKKVCAKSQALAYKFIVKFLTEKEQEILKRGRNYSGCRPPHNVSPIAYRKATGVEVLFGYLFLIGEYARLEEIFLMIFEFLKT